MKKVKRSENYDILKRFIDNKFKNLWQQHLDKWGHFNSYGIKDSYPNGKEISIEGFLYSESFARVFWGKDYIPEYIEEIFDECLEKSHKNSEKYFANPNRCLEELEELFLPKVKDTFSKMAKTDAILRNNEFHVMTDNDSLRAEERCAHFKERTKSYKLTKLRIALWYLKQIWPYLKDLKNFFNS